jgi:hypothetical protein
MGNENSLPEKEWDTEKDLLVLKPAMDKVAEGRKIYWEKVFNKRKPNWLHEQVASHPLENYWIVWIDKHMLKDVNISNIFSIT